MAAVIAVAVQEGGMPIPVGGGARLADALVALIRENGGTCETGVDVTHVITRDGRAAGVEIDPGDVYRAGTVVCNVTPTQLYGRLLGHVPLDVSRQAKRFRYGRSEMQIHFALSQPPRWDGDERLAKAAIVHLTPGLDGVSRAVNEAERGLLPAEATVVVGQPLTMDTSRAPDGRGLLWIQLQELPWHVKGDASGELAVGDGSWTPALRERYADRIQARLAGHIPNLESSLLARTVLSPADLAAANINLVNGDPYGGALTLDQNFLWRPLGGAPGHRTFVEGVWHVGASTHPGPGSVPAPERSSPTRSSSRPRRAGSPAGSPGSRAAADYARAAGGCTISTSQCACRATPWLTLPPSSRSSSPASRVPTTIRSAPCSSAISMISPTG